MIRKRSVNLFLLSVCLIGVLGIGTSALLAAHLACCGEPASCDEHAHHDKPDSPTHDHADCSFCHLFSGANGKYLADGGVFCPPGDTVVVFPVCFSLQPLLQHALTCAAPRGPPAA